MSSWQTRPTMRSRSGSSVSPPSMIAETVMPSEVPQSSEDDDDVLGHVDEAARQVAGVGRLQRRVGETLAGAVRRDEVLEHREALAEVGGDRRLDDLARGLGHEAAHAGELADLLLGAAGAGVGHDVDRVELVADLVGLLHLAEHLVGDGLGRPVPDVDDLVVALTGGDDARAALAPRPRGLPCGRRRGSSSFLAGMTMSSTPIEMPARVAAAKPRSFRSSSIRTVMFSPKVR